MRKLLNGNIRSQVIAGLIIAAILAIMGWLSGLWSAILLRLPALFQFIVSPVAIPWGVLILLSVIVTVAVVAVVRIFFVRYVVPPGPYRADVFYKLTWRWDVNIIGQIVGPYPHCPRDDTELIEHPQDVMVLYCERCKGGRELLSMEDPCGLPELKQRVVRQILVRQRDGTWKAAQRRIAALQRDKRKEPAQ